MREIKFRAISLCRGEGFVYGDLRHYNVNPNRAKCTIYEPTTGIETDIDPDTVGQFTGVYDNDGNEIYEGDIVDCWSTGRHCTCGVIKYSSPRFFISVMSDGKVIDCWNLSPSQYTGRDDFLYIKGDIHNDPQMLKGGKQ